MEVKKIIEGLIDTFLEAGYLSLDLRKKGLKKEIKSDNTPVSNGDLEVNKFITKKISELTPHIPIISEENSYNKDESDRVVLCVSLKAERNNTCLWHKTFVMDAWGDKSSTAMARLVSYPVSFAVESILKNQMPIGVQAATDNLTLISEWLRKIAELAQHFQVIVHKE